MSEEKDKSEGASNAVVGALKKFGHIYVLLSVMFIAFFTRIQGYENLKTAAGKWGFVGNDAWYHLRATMYTVKNYPELIGFDAMTGYPAGSSNGTFGTLFDLLHATVALILGAGNPSEELVRQILIFSTPVMMAFVALATYYLGKYLADSKWAGVGAATFVTFFPGTLYRRSIAGFSDHQTMEALLMVLAILTIARAMKTAEDDLIVYELFKNKEYEELKPWAKSVGLALLVIFLYYLTWPPSIVLMVFIGLSAFAYAVVGYATDRPIEPGLITTTVISMVFLLMVLVRGPTLELRLTNPSLLHVFTGIVATLGNLYLIGLNRVLDRRKQSVYVFIGGVLGLGVVAGVIVAIARPSLIDRVVEVLLRLLGNPFDLGRSQVLTIGEEQPTSLLSMIRSQYGLLLPVALVGSMIAIGTAVKEAKEGNEFMHTLFICLTFVFILILSARSVRYNYYFASFVAVFGAYAIKRFIDYAGFPETFNNIQGYHVLMLILVVLVVVPVLFVPAQGSVYQDTGAGVGGYQSWEEPLNWLSENSQDDGIEKHGSYQKKGFEYTNETYGVMSWWDYGHWITLTGDRVPVANPFQQNARVASDYLLSQSPEQAEQVIENQSEDASVRYVAIDWQMANPNSKFPAIVQFNEEIDIEDTIQPYYTTTSNGRLRLAYYQKSQTYYESMLARLYYGHGGAMESAPYTVDYDISQNGQGTFRIVEGAENPVTVHDSVEEARNASSEPEITFGGFGNANPRERVEALEHYRLIKTSPRTTFNIRSHVIEYSAFNSSTNQQISTDFVDENPSAVKLFEKVEGAEIQGQAQPNRTYTLRVIMQDPTTNANFAYTQEVQTDSNGEFSTTVPYSTFGYENTDNTPEVQASSPYQLTNSNGEVVEEFQVSETAVVDDTSDEPVVVDALSAEDDESENSN